MGCERTELGVRRDSWAQLLQAAPAAPAAAQAAPAAVGLEAEVAPQEIVHTAAMRNAEEGSDLLVAALPQRAEEASLQQRYGSNSGTSLTRRTTGPGEFTLCAATDISCWIQTVPRVLPDLRGLPAGGALHIDRKLLQAQTGVLVSVQVGWCVRAPCHAYRHTC